MAVPERFRIGSFAHADAQDHLSRSAVTHMESAPLIIRELTTTEPAFRAMVTALADAGLHTTDLHEGPVRYFMLGDGAAFGGISIFGTTAYLRSIVVTGPRRNGTGSALLQHLLATARAGAAKEVWLFTLSAAEFFAKHGFVPQPRTNAPDAIAATRQFTELCPESAVLMRCSLAP